MTRRQYRWPHLADGKTLAYGGDYNPEQWSPEIWDDDIRLMKKAHVTLVSLGIFSWSQIQPKPDVWDFEWLDTIIEKLGRAGISVDLASATATAPLWLYEAHPEVLPRGSRGEVINPGSRQSWRPTSPIFKEYALEMCRRLATRYGKNPTVVAWHVGNEYGWNNFYDYSDDALVAFREWCRKKYGSVDALNKAWGTTFWSQSVTSFEEILIPRYFGEAQAFVNPSQQLDFRRFSSDALLDFYRAERDEIEAICPDKPLTTNFMISTDQALMNYEQWSREVDFVANDHYFKEGALHLDELLCSDSLVNSLGGGKPWMLMENSTSAVNWKAVNARKRHGELIRDGLAHIASGANGVLFFQWRQSVQGAEAFHSAMLPHAGEGSTVFHDVTELGNILDLLDQEGVSESEVAPSKTAIIFDVESQWALESKTLPATANHWHDVRDWFLACFDNGVTAEVVPLSTDVSRFDTVILPAVFMLTDSDTTRFSEFVRNGGTLVVTYATGFVDRSFSVGTGGYPAALRDLLGVRSEEVNVLGDLEGDARDVALSGGGVASRWVSVVTSTSPDVDILETYQGDAAEDWDVAGLPAITRRNVGDGAAFYCGSDVGSEAIATFMRRYLTRASESSSIVHIQRSSGSASFDFYFNRLKQPSTVTLEQDREIVVLYRGEVTRHSGHSVITLERNGVVITRKGDVSGQ